MSVAAETTERCPAVRRDGRRCTAAVTSSGYCIGHGPGASEARRMGGKATSRAARAGRLLPARLRPIADGLEAAFEEVHAGRLDPKRASAMASLAGALVRVVTAGELEERVRSIEKDMSDGRPE